MAERCYGRPHQQHIASPVFSSPSEFNSQVFGYGLGRGLCFLNWTCFAACALFSITSSVDSILLVLFVCPCCHVQPKPPMPPKFFCCHLVALNFRLLCLTPSGERPSRIPEQRPKFPFWGDQPVKVLGIHQAYGTWRATHNSSCP